MSTYPQKCHLGDCAGVRTKTHKDGTLSMSCSCGFLAWHLQQDHSKNVPTTTSPDVRPYDVLDQIRAMGKMKLTLTFHD